MRLITGGAAQGKLDYALRAFGLSAQTVRDGLTDPLNALSTGGAVNRLHLLVRRLMEEGRDPADFCRSLWRENPQLVFITDEIGCGVVPIDAFERAWREKTGRICCELAREAETVDRIVAGCCQRLKG